ncbi:glycosyltransferase family 4 protein [Calothrix sp. PCC 7507]|uniref:glycosyltransferase family 4 protein n=1 Tax=Calothrix sp. PCC 7507 TaxID=99598 RepID=UPI00029F22AD|nr:glycosyltransferase family 4 protein [Calothrix sp. PCC 7507]AFY36221.1 glycosyl transferase group 1 [Calothrix sp. PCC 7507]
MDKKLLLVTFPVDLGNAKNETSLVDMFKDHLDLKIHRFIPDKKKHHSTSKLDYVAIISQRFVGSFALQKAVYQAQNEGRKVVFHGISPALFAYPATQLGSSYIITDWTRKLYEPILGTQLSPAWQTFIHKHILNSQKYILGLTDAVVEEIAKDYGVPESKLKKVKLPFTIDLNLFTSSPKRQDNEIRILFVGGDIKRKGGDILLRWFADNYQPNVKLTIVTTSLIDAHPQVTLETNVKYGEPKHIELFNNHDIFVLPTKCEGYPAVLGEAACAGLAILTTKNALGAPEIIQNGVNGYICESQEDLLKQLNILVKNKPLIEAMKIKSREYMEKEFAPELVVSEYLNYIFE